MKLSPIPQNIMMLIFSGLHISLVAHLQGADLRRFTKVIDSLAQSID
jgi:hypothetical protein